MVAITLKRIDIQEKVIIKALLDSSTTELVMSSEFVRKQGFKLKKTEKPIYVRNADSFLNKERPIEYTVEVNIYYQEHRKRTEIDVIRKQKRSVILKILWLTYYNPEIDWRTEKVKMIKKEREREKETRRKRVEEKE